MRVPLSCVASSKPAENTIVRHIHEPLSPPMLPAPVMPPVPGPNVPGPNFEAVAASVEAELRSTQHQLNEQLHQARAAEAWALQSQTEASHERETWLLKTQDILTQLRASEDGAARAAAERRVLEEQCAQLHQQQHELSESLSVARAQTEANQKEITARARKAATDAEATRALQQKERSLFEQEVHEVPSPLMMAACSVLIRVVMLSCLLRLLQIKTLKAEWCVPLRLPSQVPD